MTDALFLFAHGAGAPSSSRWMQTYRRLLEDLGTVVTFDYPFTAAGKRRPDPRPKLVEAHRAELARARARHAGKVVLIGKSMGGRIGCHVALEESVDGIVCLGYPLRGAGKTGGLRDEVLLALRTPVLFVQGTRDNLGPLDVFTDVRQKMTARNELFVVEAGNHSLEVTQRRLKSEGLTQADVNDRIIGVVRGFVATL